MTWRVELTPSAQRDLRRLDPPIAKRILEALSRFATTGRGNIQRITAEFPDQWRLRVGDWRVRFRRDYEHQIIIVLQIRPRGEAYR
jgi:mRNA interferase RelE/StbE